MTASVQQSNRLQGKDLINIGIYTVLYFVIMMLVAWLGYIPIFIPLLVVLVPFVGGIPFMLFLTKVKKFGMVLIMGILIGICMLLTGMGYWALPIGAITGLITEFILKSGGYKSARNSVFGYGVFSIWIFGNFMPFFVGSESYYAILTERFGQAYTNTLSAYLPMWIIPILIIASFVFGILGGLLGKAICKKHFKRAGIA